MVRHQKKTLRTDGERRIWLIRRPNMKHYRIRLTGMNEVTVSGPLHCREDHLYAFYKQQTAAIAKAMQAPSQAMPELVPDGWQEGTALPLFGLNYPLQIQKKHATQPDAFSFSGRSFIWYTVEQDERMGRALYAGCLREQLQTYATAFVASEKPAISIEVKRYKATWGLCRPATRRIALNLTLALLPREYTDYILHHELSHLLVPNHSNAFYQELEKRCKNWKHYRAALRMYQYVGGI